MELLSISSDAFLKPVKEALTKGQILVLHQPAYAAGMQYWYLIDRFEQFENVLETGKAASIFVAFFRANLLLQAIASSALLKEATNFLELYQEFLMVRVVPGEIELKNYCFAYRRGDKPTEGELWEIQDWLKGLSGSGVAFWYLPQDWNTNGPDLVKAYVPDRDGVIRPGFY
jgi:hypothetical protein